jgi:hypothetical protein
MEYLQTWVAGFDYRRLGLLVNGQRNFPGL